jgi:hypothetical protein
MNHLPGTMTGESSLLPSLLSRSHGMDPFLEPPSQDIVEQAQSGESAHSSDSWSSGDFNTRWSSRHGSKMEELSKNFYDCSINGPPARKPSPVLFSSRTLGPNHWANTVDNPNWTAHQPFLDPQAQKIRELERRLAEKTRSENSLLKELADSRVARESAGQVLDYSDPNFEMPLSSSSELLAGKLFPSSASEIR